ncbi:MAG: hypothetical protein ACYSUD_23460 [Planctomycetota bacterium]
MRNLKVAGCSVEFQRPAQLAGRLPLSAVVKSAIVAVAAGVKGRFAGGLIELPPPDEFSVCCARKRQASG